jgi:hypothetical protein
MIRLPLATAGLVFIRNDNVEMRSEELAISAEQVTVRYRRSPRPT